MVQIPLIVSFEDNRFLADVFGIHDQYLVLIGSKLGVDITPRGNCVAITGEKLAQLRARDILLELYRRAKAGIELGRGEVEGIIRMIGGEEAGQGPEAVRTRRRWVMPRTEMQSLYVEAIRGHDLTFGVGPAGTGKSYLAVACAAEALMKGEVDRIILSRPAVEAGERLGFLPGDMKEKVDPFLRPLYDALYDVMPANLVERGLAESQIEIAPLAFMRGRTLANAFIILDEAQNTSLPQMKMFLTRLGEGSRMVVTGDPSQVDLPIGSQSGLQDALWVLKDVKEIATIRFSGADVVRHALVGRIVDAYEQSAKQERAYSASKKCEAVFGQVSGRGN